MNEILSKRDMFGAKLRLQASKVVHSAIVEFLTVKGNENAIYKNFQDMMAQAMPLWINMFLQELDARLCLKFGVEELGIQIQFLRTLKAVLKDCSEGILSDLKLAQFSPNPAMLSYVCGFIPEVHCVTGDFGSFLP